MSTALLIALGAGALLALLALVAALAFQAGRRSRSARPSPLDYPEYRYRYEPLRELAGRFSAAAGVRALRLEPIGVRRVVGRAGPTPRSRVPWFATGLPLALLLLVIAAGTVFSLSVGLYPSPPESELRRVIEGFRQAETEALRTANPSGLSDWADKKLLHAELDLIQRLATDGQYVVQRFETTEYVGFRMQGPSQAVVDLLETWSAELFTQDGHRLGQLTVRGGLTVFTLERSGGDWKLVDRFQGKSATWTPDPSNPTRQAVLTTSRDFAQLDREWQTLIDQIAAFERVQARGRQPNGEGAATLYAGVRQAFSELNRRFLAVTAPPFAAELRRSYVATASAFELLLAALDQYRASRETADYERVLHARDEFGRARAALRASVQSLEQRYLIGDRDRN